MEQSSNSQTAITKNEQKKNTSSIVIICIAILFGLLGIGFGVYGLIDSHAKSDQISKLQAEIDQLKSSATNQKKIKIISSSWSGWSEDYEPEETESYCEIKLHEKCTVKTRMHSTTDSEEWEEKDVLSFEVTSINEDSIDIHTFQAFSDNEEGIDLRSDKQDFTIKFDETLELITPTMDAGDIFTFSITQDNDN